MVNSSGRSTVNRSAQLVECIAQSCGVIEFANEIGEFGCTGVAADGVDEVVEVQHRAGSQQHRAFGGMDRLGGVDDQPDALAEQGGVVGGGCAGTGNELVQADSLDEHRARVHHGDVEVVAQPQVVGGQRSGVSAANDDDLSALLGH
jgi:hypothetical protein